MLEERFYSLGKYLKHTFGERVNKTSIHLVPDGTSGDPDRQGYSLCPGGSLVWPVEEAGLPGVAEQLVNAKERIRQRFKTGKFVIYFHSCPNASITIDQLDRAVTEVMRDNEVIGVNISLTPNEVTDEMARFLGKINRYLYMWLELGVHSMHDETLRRMGLAHTRADTLAAIHRLLGTSLLVAPHLVLGLPGESDDMMLTTMDEVARMNIQGVSLHPIAVLTGTPLEEEYRNGAFAPIEREQYVARACDCIELLPQEVVLHRVVGEAGKDRLVAPEWLLDKKEAVAMISAEMERRNTTQGCRAATNEPEFFAVADE